MHAVVLVCQLCVRACVCIRQKGYVNKRRSGQTVRWYKNENTRSKIHKTQSACSVSTHTSSKEPLLQGARNVPRREVWCDRPLFRIWWLPARCCHPVLHLHPENRCGRREAQGGERAGEHISTFRGASAARHLHGVCTCGGGRPRRIRTRGHFSRVCV